MRVLLATAIIMLSGFRLGDSSVINVTCMAAGMFTLLSTYNKSKHKYYHKTRNATPIVIPIQIICLLFLIL